MTPNQIKYAALLLILLTGWIYGGYQKYELDSYRENQAEQVAQNEANKKQIEDENANNTKAIVSGYESQLNALNQRLSSTKTMSWGTNMPLASQGRGSSPMPSSPSSSGRVNADSSVVASFTPDDALRDTLQCEKLQEWERGVK